MKKVLILTDFTQECYESVTYGLDFCRHYGLGAEILHVDEDDFYIDEVELRRTEELVSLYRGKMQGGVDMTVKKGEFAEVMGELSRSGKFTMIIMGTHGRHGFQSLTGSAAGRTASPPLKWAGPVPDSGALPRDARSGGRSVLAPTSARAVSAARLCGLGRHQRRHRQRTHVGTKKTALEECRERRQCDRSPIGQRGAGICGAGTVKEKDRGGARVGHLSQPGRSGLLGAPSGRRPLWFRSPGDPVPSSPCEQPEPGSPGQVPSFVKTPCPSSGDAVL